MSFEARFTSGCAVIINGFNARTDSGIWRLKAAKGGWGAIHQSFQYNITEKAVAKHTTPHTATTTRRLTTTSASVTVPTITTTVIEPTTITTTVTVPIPTTQTPVTAPSAATTVNSSITSLTATSTTNSFNYETRIAASDFDDSPGVGDHGLLIPVVGLSMGAIILVLIVVVAVLMSRLKRGWKRNIAVTASHNHLSMSTTMTAATAHLFNQDENSESYYKDGVYSDGPIYDYAYKG